MTNETPAWPRKTREILTPELDSAQWNGFAFRDDDVVVNTFGKSGTTWTQAILVQLLHGAPVAPRVGNICRWVDCGFDQEGRMDAVEAQTHRRVLKSHLPLDALVFSPKAKYVHVSRDGRDVIWSAHNHLYNMNDGFYTRMKAHPLASSPPQKRPPADRRTYFLECLEKGEVMGSDFFDHTRGWWGARDLPNVYLLHFQNLKDDLPGQVEKLADFLEIELDAGNREKVLKHVSFEHMKEHADTMFPGMPMKEGGRTFINKGTNGRWRDELTAEDIAAYEAKALAGMGEDCAHWVATGEFR
jgi:aryl sulfotransferase